MLSDTTIFCVYVLLFSSVGHHLLFLVLDHKEYRVPSSLHALFLLGVSWYSFESGDGWYHCCDDGVGGGVGGDGGG